MKTLKSIDGVLARVEGWLITLFFWCMVALTFVQVCLRGLYTHGHIHWANTWMGYLDWSEPLVRLLVLWLTFLGASLLTRDNRHIKIDLFSAVLASRWLPIRELVLSLAGILICGMMSWVCIGYLNIEVRFGKSMFLGIPGWIGQLILPVGFLTILFRLVLALVDQCVTLYSGAKK